MPSVLGALATPSLVPPTVLLLEHGSTVQPSVPCSLVSRPRDSRRLDSIREEGAALPQLPLKLSPDCGCLLPQIRERLGISLGERLPTLVPVTHAMMCMNCGCDFSLTVRRHHCHACGKVSDKTGVRVCSRSGEDMFLLVGFRGPEEDEFKDSLRGRACSCLYR